MRSKLILATAVIGIFGSASSADPAASKCAEPRFHDFDFWIGEWNVRDADGKVAGANTISSEANGCVIVERWKSAAGGYGQSLNYLDAETNRWKQDWVGLGLVLHMEGEFSNGSIRMEGPLQYVVQKRVTLLRGTWTPLPDGRVRQHFEESENDGKSWKTWFDGYYARAKPGP